MQRREVLQWLAALGAIGACAPGALWARRRTSAGGRRSKGSAQTGHFGHRLMIVLLQGGPDGLSTVAPTAEHDYPYWRPTTALASDAGLDLGDGFRLHPALSPLFPLWQQKKCVVIPACGLPGAPTDHAGALACFARGMVSNKSSKSGWLGRLSMALGGWNGQMVVGSLSPVFAGAPHYKLISPGRGPSLPRQSAEASGLLRSVTPLFSGRDPLGKAFSAERRAWSAGLTRDLAEARKAAAGAVPAPRFARFGLRLGREFARRNATLGFVSVGGFDTHVGQGAATGYLADRLHETAVGLAGFAEGCGRAWERTVVVALGEFGRGIRENAYGGTENGRGGVLFVIGGAVAGGRRLGHWPGLAPHRQAGGDVAVTTDWRDVVAEIAVGHLGLPAKRLSEIFPDLKPSSNALHLLP